jgi:lipoprotein-anchoring transpeptidase ErfK/SrfK
VAVPTHPVTVLRAPGGAPLARFGRKNVAGFATVFGVVGQELDASCRAAWLHVQVPLRPNGATGWLPVHTVQLAVVHTRIEVDLSAKRLHLYRYGRIALTSPIASGASWDPTPVGRFYVKERLIPSDPNGPWGPMALGLSAYSPTLKQWTQGGPIGIHGTNEPWSIGKPDSHGCVRLPNSKMRRLFRLTLAGTPVYIHR